MKTSLQHPAIRTREGGFCKRRTAFQCRLFAWLVALGLTTGHNAKADTPLRPPPGTVTTSWIGNSFGGDGGPNGFGYWVQNGAAEIEVAPDGTVFAGVGWDESRRCAGLYKDGKVNRNLLKAPAQWENSAWGWGTGNNAVAVYGDRLYIATGGKFLLRFAWKPGDIESATFLDATPLPGVAVGLSAGAKQLAVVYSPNAGRKEGTPPIVGGETVEIRDRETRAVQQTWKLEGGRDVAFAPNGDLWTLANKTVCRYAPDGTHHDAPLPDLQAPSAIAFGADGKLLVCDNGPRQQVLIYTVHGGTAKRVQTFGVEGGLRAGVAGEVKPDKLFALCGAGTDKAGNLYVGMSYQPEGTGNPNGNFVLRAFAPDGRLLWQRYNLAFVDTFGFDPDSDGARVYSRTAMFALDLNKIEPGTEAQWRGVTLDPLDAQDQRLRYGGSVVVRNVQGRRLLFVIGQYAGGYTLYAAKGKEVLVHKVNATPKFDGETWAWYVAPNGDIWQGDPPNKKEIRRYAFLCWNADGTPRYEWNNPQTWPRPEGWDTIRRIVYDAHSDSLYMSGYLTGQRIETWGVVGTTLRRYDGWRKGTPTVRWTNAELPRDGNPDPKEGPLTPEALDIAGEYCFLGMTRANEGKERVFILRLSDGGFVGTLTPGDAVGGNAGWLDMPYAVQALKRRNGEYLILAEEDARGKNLLYRWKP